MSNRLNLALILVQKSSIDFKLPKSNISTSTLLFLVSKIIFTAASSALFLSLHASITRAPRLAKSKAVS
jgi:hypothetical protein